MKLFKIEHRFTGKILFKLETESLRLCVEAAVEAEADLSRANLSRAELSRKDGEKIKIEKIPLQILGLFWDIIIFDSHMKIGCEFHSIADWGEFDDERINNMDSNALAWWQKNKASILSFCAANGRGDKDVPETECVKKDINNETI